MKINSEHLYKYINELATDEKVKFNVYYDDSYVTQIYWNGDNFEWETGTFTSEAFFNPFYDFIPIEEEKKIPEKLEDYDFDDDLDANTKCECLRERMQEIENQLDEIIDYLKSKGE